MKAARLVLCLMLAAGCSTRRSSNFVSPEPLVPPVIDALSPSPGSSGVSDRPEIWVRFTTALDPASVTDRTVSLLVDTRYVEIALRYEHEQRRIVLHPIEPLRVGRTHTVRLDAHLRTHEGIALGKSYSWQFRTQNVATPRGPYPANGAVDESPFAAMFWDTSLSDPGVVRFRLYASTDSAAVAARSLPPTDETSLARFVPSRSWGVGACVYWSVTAVDSRTGDRSDGPVWRFCTVPSNASVATARLELSDWTHYDPLFDDMQCFGGTFWASGRFRAAIRWDLRPLGPLRIHSATVTLNVTLAGSAAARPMLNAAASDWRACDLGPDGPPDAVYPPLGSLTGDDRGGLVLSSDALAAHVEAMTRYRGFHGFVITGGSPYQFRTEGSLLEISYFVGRATPGVVTALDAAPPIDAPRRKAP